MINKLNSIMKALNEKYLEREEEVEGMMISLLSRQHMLLIGEPGTGKSLLSMELSNIIEGSNYFQWLVTKYTTPEELFGALSFKELEQGIHSRNTNGKLPEADFVFLDEIFKGNSAILNSLLTLINERVFYNNGKPTRSPLVSMIGASNEYPEEDEGLEAMYDRLLLKYEVKPVQERKNRMKIRKREGFNIQVPSLTMKELQELQFHVEMTNMSDAMHEKFDDIYMELKDEGINISQRRTDKAISAIKAKALMDQRTNVVEKDMMILQHIMWNSPEEKKTARSVVKDHAQDVVENVIEQVTVETNEIIKNMDNAKVDNPYGATAEATKKFRVLKNELIRLTRKNPNRENDIQPLINELEQKEKDIVNDVLIPIG